MGRLKRAACFLFTYFKLDSTWNDMLKQSDNEEQKGGNKKKRTSTENFIMAMIITLFPTIPFFRNFEDLDILSVL